MKIRPAVLREDFWGDLANTFLLRPVYRETKQEHAAKAAATNAKNERATATTAETAAAGANAENEQATATTAVAAAEAAAVQAAAETAAGVAALAAAFVSAPQKIPYAKPKLTSVERARFDEALAQFARTMNGPGGSGLTIARPSSEETRPTTVVGRHARVIPDFGAVVLPSLPERVLPTSEALLKDWAVNALAFQRDTLVAAYYSKDAPVAGASAREAIGREQAVLAVSQTQETINFFRGLHEAEPEEYAWNLAGALLAHAKALATDDRHDDAVKAAAEAIQLYRSRPVYGEGFAAALNTYAEMLTMAGRTEEAADLGEEATHVYEELFEKYPRAYEPGLVAAKIGLSKRQATAGAYEQALANAADAVARSRKMEERIPGGHTADLALALANYAERLAETGDAKKATAALEEAAELYEKLTESYPASYTSQLDQVRQRLSRLRGATTEMPDADTDEGPSLAH